MTEMYLSHGKLDRGLVSSLTQRRLFNAHKGSAFHSPQPIPMAYFNNTNASFYSTFAPEELDTYPSLNQASTNEGANDQGFSTFAYGWNTPRQPGPMIGPATSQWATVSHGEYPVAFSSSGILRVHLQSQRPRPAPTPTAIVGQHTLASIGRRLANRPNYTTPAP